jgi:hypothetical protein
VIAIAVETKGNGHTAKIDAGKRVEKFNLTSDALRQDAMAVIRPPSRHRPGVTPVTRLKARLKAASES